MPRHYVGRMGRKPFTRACRSDGTDSMPDAVRWVDTTCSACRASLIGTHIALDGRTTSVGRIYAVGQERVSVLWRGGPQPRHVSFDQLDRYWRVVV